CSQSVPEARESRKPNSHEQKLPWWRRKVKYVQGTFLAPANRGGATEAPTAHCNLLPLMASSIFKYVFMDFFKPMVQLLLFVFPAFYTAVFSLLVFFAFVVFLGRNSQPATFVFDPQVIAIADPRLVPADHANASGLPFPAPPLANTSLGVRRTASPENTSDLAPAAANHSAEAKKGREKGQEASESSKDLATCDLFDGRWVFDESTPRYPPGSCPFIDSSFDCFGNGRPDQNYTKLRWKPKGCSIPRSEVPSLSALRFFRLFRFDAVFGVKNIDLEICFVFSVTTNINF
ncbi:hypothetical protein B296_00055738, partial [Ensete ventricosum]